MLTYTKRRNRLAEQAIEKYGLGRLMVAAGLMLAKERNITLFDEGEGPEFHVTQDEIAAYFETLDERGVKRLIKVARNIGEGEKEVLH